MRGGSTDVDGAPDVRGLRALDLLVLVGYAAVTIPWLWPLPLHPWSRSFYDAGGFPVVGTADFYLIVWAMSWVAHAVVRSPLHLFDANTFHPAPLTLAYSEHLAGYLPLFGPIYWITGNGLFALNVTAFLTYPLCAWFTYLTARRFIGRPGALVAGALFAFCGSRYEVGSHFHMLGVQYLPVIVYALDAWLERARTGSALLLAAALVLQTLSSVYLAYATMLLGIAVGPLLLVEHRRRLDRRRLVGLGIVLAIVGIVLVVSMLPYLRLHAYGLVPDYDGELVPYGLIPTLTRAHLGEYLERGAVGRLGFALALAGALPGGGASYRRVRRVGVALVLVGIVSALGPRITLAGREWWSPYTILMDVVPGFATVRLPTRFTVIAQLGFSLLAGVGVARVLRDRRPLIAYGGALACVAVTLAGRLSLAPLPPHIETFSGNVAPAYRWLAKNGDGRSVLELPRARTAAAAARRAYVSTYHWQPIFEGYGAYPAQHGAFLYEIASGLPDADALQELVDHVDVGWVLVHRDELSPAAATRWQGALPEGMVQVAEWPDAAIYRVDRHVQNDRRSRLLSTERTVQDTPIAPLGDRCDGTLMLVDRGASPIVAGSEVRMVLRLENRSDATWPAFGFYPRGLVEVRADVRRPDGGAVSKWRVALRQDPRPFEPVDFDLVLRMPSQPGRYVMAVNVVQSGVKDLRECGVPTLDLPMDVVAKPAPAG